MLAQIFDRTQDDKNVCGYFFLKNATIDIIPEIRYNERRQ